MKIRKFLAVLLVACAACAAPLPAPTPATATPPVAEMPPTPPPASPHVYDCEDRRVEIQAYVDRTGVRNTVLTLIGQVERVYLVDRAGDSYAITHYDGVDLHCAYDVP